MFLLLLLLLVVVVVVVVVVLLAARSMAGRLSVPFIHQCISSVADIHPYIYPYT